MEMYEDDEKQSRFAALESWLTNMFWYHYKWYYIVGIFIASLLILSAISFIKNVDYDWTITYAHIGIPSSDESERIRSAYKLSGTDVTGNGKVQIGLSEDTINQKTGYYSLYGELNKADNMIFTMDDATLKLYQGLGYFKDAVYIDGLGLWAGINNTPIELYTLGDFAGYNYTQANIDDANQKRQEEHDKLIIDAKTIVNNTK